MAWRKCVASASLAILAGTGLYAQQPVRLVPCLPSPDQPTVVTPLPPRMHDCPPVQPGITPSWPTPSQPPAGSVNPATPPGHSPTQMPSQPPGQTPTQTPATQPPASSPAAASDSASAFASAPQAGSEGTTSFAPHMFGDIFGRTTNLRVASGVNVTFPGSPIGVLFSAAPGQGPGGTTTFAANSAFTRFGTTFPQGFTYNSLGQAANNQPVIPIAPNSQEADAARRFAARQFGPGGALIYLQGQSLGTLVTPSGSGVGNPNFPLATYSIDTEYRYVLPQMSIQIPNPASGGPVGRTKLADDNNPLPRDRVFLNYDYFDNVPITQRGAGVHRFSPGFEKTFLDGSTSIEVRFPFAASVSSTITTDGIANDRTSFGNLHMTFKALLYTTQTINLAAGLSAAFPTADDTRVRLTDGTDLLRIRNETVILTPYIGALLTPTREVFAQVWAQLGFDPSGNPVEANLDLSGLQRVGRLRDRTLGQFDVQLGYWFFRANQPGTVIQGLAPFAELHYNTTVSSGGSVNLGSYSVGQFSSFDEVNLGAGLIAWLRGNLNLSLGVVAPLRSGPNRSFDYQIGIRGSYFFGRSASSTSPATQVAGF